LSGKADSGEEAISQIRELRPCSLETTEQEEIVINFATRISEFKIN